MCSPFRSILSRAGEKTLVFCLAGCPLRSAKVHNGVEIRITVTKSPQNRSPEQNRERHSWGWNRNQGRNPEAQVEKGTGAGGSPWGNAHPPGDLQEEELGNTSPHKAPHLHCEQLDVITTPVTAALGSGSVWVKKQYLLYFCLVTGKLTGYCLWGSCWPPDWSPT